MTNPKDVFKKMQKNLGEEKQNLNQFFLTANHTVTELYRTDSYIERLRACITKLEDLMAIHKILEKTAALAPGIKERKEYTNITSQIAVEFNYLIKTNQAMNDNLKEINRTGEIQGKISGKMIGLKKEIDKTIKKVSIIVGEPQG